MNSGLNVEGQAISNRRPVLEVSDLRVTFVRGTRKLPALDGVSFRVYASETLCIVGASGSGKSVCCRSLLRLLPPTANVTGSVRLIGNDIFAVPESELRRHRGSSVGMVFQNPFASFNPTATIGSHIFEAMRAHKRISRAEAIDFATQLLVEVDLDSPAELLRKYPHQLSGGMLQRVMLATALAHRPHLLVADEPTGSIDVLSRNKILALLSRLKDTRHMAQIVVTHDMRVAATIADHILILHDGKIAEHGPCATIISNPQTLYSRELRRASFGS